MLQFFFNFSKNMDHFMYFYKKGQNWNKLKYLDPNFP